MLAKVGEGFAKVNYVVFALFASHDDIVDVRRDIPVQLSVKYCCDGSVERAPSIAKPFRHPYVAVSAEGCGKTGLLLI
jgi:hypothetical protein